MNMRDAADHANLHEAGLRCGKRLLVPYQPTHATFCAESYLQKSHQIIAGTIIASVIRHAAAVAARPALVR